jgi:glutamate carboxypeptidase
MDDSLRKQILAFVEEHSDEELRFVIDLCNENSYTYNPRGTNRVAGVVLERLSGIFPHHKVVRQADVGDHHILRTRPGSQAIYLLGHMDTVFPPDHPFQKCRLEGDWLAGPGTGDMKGGLAIIVYALKALKQSGLTDRLSITLILGSDEETGAATSEAVYEREKSKAAACMVAECAGPRGEVVVSRNGKAGGCLECFGQEIHVGDVGEEKSSAILELAHKIVALESLNGRYPGASVNVGKVEGGLGPCTVPGSASCLFDMRWVDEKHYEMLLTEARSISEGMGPHGTKCKLVILNHRPAMPQIEGTRRMFEALRLVADSLGMSIGTEHRRGTSDANYFGAAGVPTLDGFGPVCHDDHTERERILVSSLLGRTCLLAVFLADYGLALG